MAELFFLNILYIFTYLYLYFSFCRIAKILIFVPIRLSLLHTLQKNKCEIVQTFPQEHLKQYKKTNNKFQKKENKKIKQIAYLLTLRRYALH